MRFYRFAKLISVLNRADALDRLGAGLSDILATIWEMILWENESFEL